LGQASLLVYWVHMEFVYGRLSLLHKHGVGLGAATVGLVVIFLGMVALAALRTRSKRRGAVAPYRTSENLCDNGSTFTASR
jgi:hypothetical protein